MFTCVKNKFRSLNGGLQSGRRMGSVMFTLLFAAVVSVYMILLLPNLRYALLCEDGIIETGSALFWLMASAVCFRLFITERRGNDLFVVKTGRNVFLLGLGLLFFFGFAEEISWGQRVFGWETPAVLGEMNEQNEINVHNLAGLQIERLFSVFWLFYAVCVPVIARFSAGALAFIRQVNLPVMPVWIGILFPVNYLISKLAQPAFQGKIENMPIEIKEYNFALLFFVFSLWLLKNSGISGRFRSTEVHEHS